jgi:gliding motility-associatede transport system auxiliary component
MGRSASLFGVLGTVLLGFSLLSAFVLPVDSWYVVGNFALGGLLLLAYVVFGFESFRALFGQRSTRYGAGAIVYTVLFVVLLIGVNYLGTRYHHRWDVTEAGVYTLSPQSHRVVEELSGTLTMTAFVEAGLDPDLEALLDTYRYAAPEHVEMRLVDPDREPVLVDQMKITAVPSINLAYGNESFVVTKPSEEAITNGIIRVAGAQKKVVYFLQGFGQLDVDDDADPKGYSAAKLALEQENYDVRTAVWPSLEKLPADANAVVIPGVGQGVSDHAIAILDTYLDGGGHLAVAIGPREGDDRLTALLARWGAKLGEDIVIDQELQLFSGPRLGVQPLSNDYGTHPITEGFRGYAVFPQTRTVEPDATGKKGLTATGLVKTGPSSWAETQVDAVFDEGLANLDADDRRGPVTVAVASEATLVEMGRPAPAEGDGKARLVVFGTPLFAINQQLTQRGVNADLFLNAIGWLVGQEELVAVRPRSVRSSRAELTAEQATSFFYLSVLFIPEFLVLLGVAVSWRRRSR